MSVSVSSSTTLCSLPRLYAVTLIAVAIVIVHPRLTVQRATMEGYVPV